MAATIRRSAVPRDGARAGGGWVRTAPLVPLPALLRAFGVDPEAIFARAGLSLRILDDPDNLISFRNAGFVLERAAAAARCPYLGLLAGNEAGAASLGALSDLIRQAPTVGDALGQLVRFLHVHDRGAVPAMEIHGSTAMLSYAICEPDTPGTAQIYDTALAIGCNIMRAICGSRWNPAEVRFLHLRPPILDPYRRIFRSPLRFGAEQSALVFPQRCLEQIIPEADAGHYRNMRRNIEMLEAQAPLDFAGQLQRMLRSLVLNERGSIQDVAGMLSMHRRTLNRRLRQCGTTFRSLVDQARREVARQLLENTEMSIGEIATTLDYADTSAFTRAFTRWMGAPPAVWRVRGARRRVSPTIKSLRITRGQ